MVNKHQFQMLAKAFRAGKISLSDFTEQAYNPPAADQPRSSAVDGAKEKLSTGEGSASDGTVAQ
jgi:hypothetical protein